MLRGMTETPEKSPSEPLERPDRHERDDSADMERDTIALPSHVAGSGTLDRLVETARDYARQAASENTLKAYAKDWAHFTRWCRMRGADSLPSSPQLIGLYIADLATPGGKAPALSVSSIERRLSGLTWGYAQRGERLDRKDRHISSVLAGTMFRVELNNQHLVLATVCGKMRKRWVRLTVGDRVKMEMSPYDLNKARITWRIG